MCREQENSHLGWPDHTHGIAGFSDWGKTKLKTRCWMGWVLIWRHWWKTHLHAFLSCWQNSVFCGCRTEVSASVCVYVSHSVVSNSVTPWTVDCQAPLSMEFSRQEYWSELLFPSPRDLPTQGLNPGLLHCRQILLCRLSGPPGKPRFLLTCWLFSGVNSQLSGALWLSLSLSQQLCIESFFVLQIWCPLLPFTENNLVVFSIFTILYNHYLFVEYFHHPIKNPYIHYISHSPYFLTYY